MAHTDDQGARHAAGVFFLVTGEDGAPSLKLSYAQSILLTRAGIVWVAGVHFLSTGGFFLPSLRQDSGLAVSRNTPFNRPGSPAESTLRSAWRESKPEQGPPVEL